MQNQTRKTILENHLSHLVEGSNPPRLTLFSSRAIGKVKPKGQASPKKPALYNSQYTPTMPDLADYMTTEDAAKKLDFHIDHIRRMLRGGDLEGLKLGREWLVSKKSVEKYLKDTEGMDKRDPRRGNK